MSSSPQKDPPEASERSTFLQRTGQYDAVASHWIFWPALLIGVTASIYIGDWKIGLAIAVAAYLVLGIAYAILASIFGWRRMGWMSFVGEILSWIGW